MAKAKAVGRGTNPINLQNLSERDRDFLTMDTKEVMKMYKVDKQAVYDRRHLLKKRITEANTTVDAVLNKSSRESKTLPKKAAAKTKPQAAPQNKEEVKTEEHKTENQPQQHSRDIVPYEKAVPVIMKPIEINFENFSVKLNGVPKKISVNPETNAIEIDL